MGSEIYGSELREEYRGNAMVTLFRRADGALRAMAFSGVRANSKRHLFYDRMHQRGDTVLLEAYDVGPAFVERCRRAAGNGGHVELSDILQ